MESIKYLQENHLMVMSNEYGENAPLIAGHGNSIVTENSIWFDPPQPDFSSLTDMVNTWNETPATERTDEMALRILHYNFGTLYSNSYGVACGVISYKTTEAILNTNSISLASQIYHYDGNEQFWYLQDASMTQNMQKPVTCLWTGSTSTETLPYGVLSPYSMMGLNLTGKVTGADGLAYIEPSGGLYYGLSGNDWGKLRFYNHTKIMALGQPYVTASHGLRSPEVYPSNIYMFNLNFTGNKGVLPVGLVMLRDVIDKSLGNVNVNNFGIYGFVISMPFFMEPSKTIRGFSLGRELFTVGNGLKAEVFFGIIKSTRDTSKCVISNANFGNGESGNLDKLFSGKNSNIRFSIGENPLADDVVECTNIYHDIIDFSIPGARDGVFYFKTPITYDMGVKYLVFGMRPYDINGNGREYPPSSNPYGTDTSFLGNYALVDISAKKFYLL